MPMAHVPKIAASILLVMVMELVIWGKAVPVRIVMEGKIAASPA